MRVGWARRLGVALALLVLGATVVLAGTGLADGDRGRSSPPPGSSQVAMDKTLPPDPPAAPAIVAPIESLTTAARVDVDLVLAGQPRGATGYRLRLYINDELVRDRRLPRGSPFTLRGVQLSRGENVLVATVRGPGGESLPSAPVVITRDDVAPSIDVSAPNPRAPIVNEQVTVEGRTEALASVTVLNLTTGWRTRLDADEAGNFRSEVPLAMGRNDVQIRSRDPAGNSGLESLALARIENMAAVTIEIFPEGVELSALPARITILATVLDDLGQPVDGAEVFFSLSPPGQATATFHTTTTGGTAAWRSVRLAAEGALAGQGRVTVMVTLPTGTRLQENASFTVRSTE